ncbi:kinesin-like protein [Kipferlia bialata]|uniref:Kinesin-like protein n=1 Tax=Kipferlia bialata TaxID=797122 RepID=A0A9K3GDZ2_9EUKA|nr:kinesin-like protein [Kipferlia bialata]|eukprot:g1177.t1
MTAPLNPSTNVPPMTKHTPRKETPFKVYIRVKPLGAGGGGGEQTRHQQQGTSSHTLTFNEDTVALREVAAIPVSKEGDSAGPPPWRKGRKKSAPVQGSKPSGTFSYAKQVIQPSQDQADTYDILEIEDLVQAFQDGYNVNFLANGQTGSGKTHCIFGPPTVDWASASSAPDYGILPRAALAILQGLNEAETTLGDTYVLTGSMLETTYSLTGLGDLLDPSLEAYLDNNHDVVGAMQVPLRSREAIMSFISTVEARATRATGMNDTSSRSHCVTQLRLWRHSKRSGKVRLSTFNFLDLAGAERLSEAHDMWENFNKPAHL